MNTVSIDSFEGLLVDHAKEVGATGIIRGLRQVSDFEFEFQMALMNRKLADDIATIFLMPHERYTYLNSTIIRNLASLRADVSDFVPPIVQEALKKKLVIINNEKISINLSFTFAACSFIYTFMDLKESDYYFSSNCSEVLMIIHSYSYLYLIREYFLDCK